MSAEKQKIFIVILNLSCIFLYLNSYAQFSPGPQNSSSNAIHKNDTSISFWADEIKIERGWLNISDTSLGKATVGSSINAHGKANTLIVSLGDSGQAVVQFPFPIYNEPGYDFAVFENGFAPATAQINEYFLELATVEVSENGIDFYPFVSTSNTPTSTQVGSFAPTLCTNINNIAGKYPLNYGTPFDIEELGLDSIVSIKIIDVVGSIDSLYASYDYYGNIINDPFPTAFSSGGFDLNAVAALNQKNVIIDSTDVQTSIFSLENMSFSIFPNPINQNEILTIIGDTDKIEFIELYNILGESIYSTNKISLKLSDFSKGIYFLKIVTKNAYSTHKFIVE